MIHFDFANADVRQWLAEQPENSVHCIVTSPPYYQLRDYGVDGQIGMEATLAEHLQIMVDVFAAARRVLRPDGVLWLNYGDAWAQPGTPPEPGQKLAQVNSAYDREFDRNRQRAEEKGYVTSAFSMDTWRRATGTCRGAGLAPKQKMFLPHRVAIALQDSGWWVRDDDVCYDSQDHATELVWRKRNGKPDSVKDRPSRGHEYVFLLAKHPRYFYDTYAVREESGAQLRSVWDITNQPTRDGHTATFPEEMARRCILLGTSTGCCEACGAPRLPVYKEEADPEWKKACGAVRGGYEGRQLKNYSASKAETPGDIKARTLAGLCKRRLVGHEDACSCAAPTVPCTVMDPFGGSATTGVVALRHGRRFVGCELNPEYHRIGTDRLQAARKNISVAEERSRQLALFEGGF